MNCQLPLKPGLLWDYTYPGKGMAGWVVFRFLKPVLHSAWLILIQG
jgi:hypothetical protein